MPAPRRFTDSEMAERLRALAQRSAEPDKRRYFRMATMYEVQMELVESSRRRIAESRLLLAAIEKQVP